MAAGAPDLVKVVTGETLTNGVREEEASVARGKAVV